MKKFSFLSMLLLGLILTFAACNKDDDNNDSLNEDVITTEDLTAVEDLVLDAEDEIEELIENGIMAEGEVEVREDCPTRTVEPADGTFPKTITIDYGDGCTSPRSREKSGQIVIVQSAPLNETGATRTITFVDYYVDGAHLEGTTTLTNNGNSSFTRGFEHKITYPDGDVAMWEAEHTYTVILGANTPRMFDDVVKIEGSSSGTNRDGKTYSAEIIEPLIKAKICPWVGNGIRQVNRNGNVFTIDYGFGGEDCDNKAQVTLPNGETRVIRIEPRWRR
ncbi:MAG: hypothetical protein IPJ74_05775 [Saprospiraceae bacterium]|nr:hypothetical protein [Saprospiraceae bacterium]